MELNFKQFEKMLGWLQPSNADILFQYAMKSPINRVLELGSFCGKSTCVLATAMKEKKGLVVAIDYFIKNQKYWGSKESIIIEDTFQSFWKNLGICGLTDYVIAFKSDHASILEKMSGKFGMVYIDGGHIVKHVVPNMLFAWEHIVEGGYIVFDDYNNQNWPDVKVCVDVFCKKFNLELLNPPGTMAVIQKKVLVDKSKNKEDNKNINKT